MADSAMQDGEDPVVIKKYANRRLYNTAKSSYVTLEHLAEMVRAGEDFVVRDAKSGEDITHAVLTQIIFEEEAKGKNLLPANFLRQLIRLYGDTLQGFVPGYLDAAIDSFARNQEQLREQVGQAFGSNPGHGAVRDTGADQHGNVRKLPAHVPAICSKRAAHRAGAGRQCSTGQRRRCRGLW